jgi:hypothetical protein
MTDKYYEDYSKGSSNPPESCNRVLVNQVGGDLTAI